MKYSACRYLNLLCTPVLYREINLLSERKNSFSSIEQYIMQPHALHITVLRLSVVGWSLVIRVLKHCKNLHSLSLYFTQTALHSNYLGYLSNSFQPIIEQLQAGKLTSLGIYSPTVVNGSFDRRLWRPNIYDTGAMLLDAILKSEKAADALQVLDLATDSMIAQTYDGLRSGFKNLRSLTIRRSFHNDLGGIWDDNQQRKWYQKTNLTRLYLRDCDNVPAFHVPGLVQHFPSIEELFIIACGNDDYFPSRSKGWSLSPSALCNVRVPLRTFHIEHMNESEIMAMGIIPVTTLSIVSRQLIILLIRDREIFPGLKALRTYPGTKQDSPGTEYEDMTLENLCKARGIELLLDLPASKGCGPTCKYI